MAVSYSDGNSQWSTFNIENGMVTKLVMILAVAMTALARLGGAVPFLDKKVLEIASAVGMSNVDYSQTAFKRYFGVTPRTYRQQARDA